MSKLVFCVVFLVRWVFYLKAWHKALNDEQSVMRAECFGGSRGTGWQLGALEVPDHINLKCEQSFKKLTS